LAGVVITLSISLAIVGRLYHTNDVSWQNYVSDIELSHWRELRTLEEEQQRHLDAYFKIGDIHGYHRALYSLCFSLSWNIEKCLDLARQGYLKQNHNITAPQWDWDYVRYGKETH
jgi:hypothetical protein